MKTRIVITVLLLLASAIVPHRVVAHGYDYSNMDLSGWDFSNQDLRDSRFFRATLTNTMFSGSLVQGTDFGVTTSRGFTSNQLYSTASYQLKDLSGIGLSYNNMNGWDFSGQNLTDSDFRSTTLTNANLSGANLTGARFYSSRMPGANLHAADLTGATFNGVRLMNGNLESADLSHASFYDVTLTNANMTNATVFGTDFSGAVQYGFTSNQLYSTASYKAKNLGSIGFLGNNVSGWDFAGHNLEGANFAIADMTNVNMRAANLTGASLNGAKLLDSDLSLANLTGADLGGAILTGADITDAEIRGANFGSTTYHGLTSNLLYSTASYKAKTLGSIGLVWNDLGRWSFAGQNMAGANFYRAILAQTDLESANLTDANFENTVLTNANLHSANLTGASFLDANITGVDFTNSIVAGANFFSTTYMGFTSNQLYSTASYQAKNLKGIGLLANDLKGWDFAGQDLTDASFYQTELKGANFTNAVIKGADFSGTGGESGFSSNQLYSTASYQVKDLSGAGFAHNTLDGWDFSGQNLNGADFYRASLGNANLTNAIIRDANLSDTVRDGWGLASTQFYSTASYQLKNLSGINLSGNRMRDWDFSGQNLTGSDFTGATLTDANFSGANLHLSKLASVMPSFDVLDGADISISSEVRSTGHIHNQSGGTLYLTGQLLAESYRQDEGAALHVGVWEHLNNASPDIFPLSGSLMVSGRAEFEADAIIGIYAADTNQPFHFLEHNQAYTNQIVEAGELVVGGSTNVTDLSAFQIKNSLLHADFYAENHSIYAILERLRLADTAGFEDGSMMVGVCDAIDSSSHANASAMLTRLDGMPGSEQNRQLDQLYNRAIPVHNVQQQNCTRQSRLMAGRGHTFRGSNGLATGRKVQPQGPAGPHVPGQGLEAWSRTYGNWVDREGDADYTGYDANLWGQIFGLDRVFGKTLLGAAGGASRSNLSADNGDSADVDSGFGALYSSWGTVDWFLDANLSYANSSVDHRSGTAFDTEASYRTDTYGAYLGGGREFSKGETLAITPEVTMQVSYYDQPAYREESTTAIPREVEAYDHWSVMSSVGGSMELLCTWLGIEWKPAARIFWQHEFNADSDRVNYRLAGGSDQFSFALQAPEEDSIRAGLGLTALLGERWELGGDIDGIWADNYQSLTASANIRFRF
ncbi:MAG: pentapeptide repeat-containing protein [Kiritimatiellales bacterium]|nr:pentapeptide repeat-containing protein [Kiritimatiellales bacterium]